MQTIINPLVVSVGPTSETIITPVPMTHHGGGVKKVIAVVAAIAIPIAAPAIASAIAGSAVLGATVSAAMATTAGAVVSSAIVGAGLGAITAKVTGGDVKAGAISGLIGGGIGGYASASKPGMFGNAATPAANTSTTASTLSGGNTATAGNTTTVAGGEVVNASFTPGGAEASLSNTAMTGSTVASSGADAAASLSGSTGFLDTMKTGLSSAGQMIADRLTNPDTLANAVLQVGGAVAAEAIVGTPDTSPETQQAIEEYKKELTALKARDEDAFNAKMDAAKQYMVQAGYYDPQYFGLQSANRAAIAEGRKLREFERKAGLKQGGVSAGDRRRAALSGGANVQSAFDRGFISGVDLQNKAMSTGVGLIPNAPTGAASAQLGLANFYAGQDSAAQRAADAKKANIQKFFGAFSSQSGLTDAERAARAKKSSAGLNTGNMPSLDQKKNNIPDPFVIDPDKKKKDDPQGIVA